MKAIFLSFDQAHREDVLRVLDKFMVRGFTLWEGTQGCGTHTGSPHYGSHAWPSLNNSMFIAVDDDKVAPIKSSLQALDEASPMLGLRIFVLNVEDVY